MVVNWFINIRNVLLVGEKFLIVAKKGHKYTHCRKSKNKKGAKMKNTINAIKTENSEIKMKKFGKIQMNYKLSNWIAVQMWHW